MSAQVANTYSYLTLKREDQLEDKSHGKTHPHNL